MLLNRLGPAPPPPALPSDNLAALLQLRSFITVNTSSWPPLVLQLQDSYWYGLSFTASSLAAYPDSGLGPLNTSLPFAATTPSLLTVYTPPPPAPPAPPPDTPSPLPPQLPDLPPTQQPPLPALTAPIGPVLPASPTPKGESPSAESNMAGPLAGGVVGGLLLAAGAIAAVTWMRGSWPWPPRGVDSPDPPSNRGWSAASLLKRLAGSKHSDSTLSLPGSSAHRPRRGASAAPRDTLRMEHVNLRSTASDADVLDTRSSPNMALAKSMTLPDHVTCDIEMVDFPRRAATQGKPCHDVDPTVLVDCAVLRHSAPLKQRRPRPRVAAVPATPAEGKAASDGDAGKSDRSGSGSPVADEGGDGADKDPQRRLLLPPELQPGFQDPLKGSRQASLRFHHSRSATPTGHASASPAQPPASKAERKAESKAERKAGARPQLVQLADIERELLEIRAQLATGPPGVEAAAFEVPLAPPGALAGAEPPQGGSDLSSALPGLMLHAQLGSGSHGTVYRATWRGLDVAVKRVLFQQLAGGEGDRRRKAVLQEANITARLNHPNIIATYTCAMVPLRGPAGFQSTLVVDWTLLLVQELCNGGSLLDEIRSGWMVDPDTRQLHYMLLLQYVADMASGLAYLHKRGIIHGDFKCENVLLSHRVQEDGSCLTFAKVCDFGLSMTLEQDQTHVSGVRHGTPLYLAPEVLQTSQSSRAADVYAFGICCWELLHQKPLWEHIAEQARAAGPDNAVPQAGFLLFADLAGLPDAYPGAPGGADPALIQQFDMHATPMDLVKRSFARLATRCMATDPLLRPTIEQVCAELDPIRQLCAAVSTAATG
ncbi:kinase-like domain-containing protein [Haematococcus lacustris]